MTYNLLIVEDHELTRYGLSTAFGSAEFISEIYEATSAEEAIEIVKNQKIDVVIMDLGLPMMNGIEAISVIKNIKSEIKFVVLTSHSDEEEVISAVKAGANSYCSKDVKPKKLVEIVLSTLDGASWFDPKVSAVVLDYVCQKNQIIEKKEEEKDYKLTLREKQVLRLMADGLSNQEIAKNLAVSINTTKAHVCSILQKLEVEDRTQAVIKVLREKII